MTLRNQSSIFLVAMFTLGSAPAASAQCVGCGYDWIFSYLTPPNIDNVIGNKPSSELVRVDPKHAPAKLHLILPSGEAQVTIDGRAMSGSGTDRIFDTPPLEYNKIYSYAVSVTWTQDGKPVTVKRDVPIEAHFESYSSFREPDATPLPAPRRLTNPTPAP